MFIFMSRSLHCSVLQAIAFKGMGKALSDFAVVYDQYPTLHSINSKKLYKEIFWRITMMQILIFIAVAAHSSILLVHNMKSSSSITLPILISSFNGIMLYVMEFPPSVTGKQLKNFKTSLSNQLFFQRYTNWYTLSSVC